MKVLTLFALSFSLTPFFSRLDQARGLHGGHQRRVRQEEGVAGLLRMTREGLPLEAHTPFRGRRNASTSGFWKTRCGLSQCVGHTS